MFEVYLPCCKDSLELWNPWKNKLFFSIMQCSCNLWVFCTFLQYLCLNAILNLSPLSEIDNRFSFVFCFPEPIKTYLSNNSNQSDLKLEEHVLRILAPPCSLSSSFSRPSFRVEFSDFTQRVRLYSYLFKAFYTLYLTFWAVSSNYVKRRQLRRSTEEAFCRRSKPKHLRRNIESIFRGVWRTVGLCCNPRQRHQRVQRIWLRNL